MKCNNCGFENNSGSCFCGSCGKPLNQNTASIQQSEQASSSNKKKKKNIVIGSIVVCILLVMVVTKLVNNGKKFKDPFEDVDDLTIASVAIQEEADVVEKSFSAIIEKDYKKGFLTSDEYILQLAYSIFDSEKLDSSYKSLDLDSTPGYLFEEAERLLDELSDDTALYIFELLTLDYVEWDVGDNPNVIESGASVTKDYEAVPLGVKEGQKVSKLDHVKLSKNGHFLIYYTTSGRNAVSESRVDEIASYMERLVDQYESIYGLSFKYEPSSHFSTTTTIPGSPVAKVYQLLKKNNLEQYIDTALPVYIVDTDVSNSNALGYYVAKFSGLESLVIKVCASFGEDNEFLHGICYSKKEGEEARKQAFKSASAAYHSPFFVVNSTIDDMGSFKSVTAHELFHHYQKYICGDGSYGECNSGEFTIETTADLVAAEVSGVHNRATVLNNHAGHYVNNTSASIDNVGKGYAAFVFAHNYAEIVDNGTNHLFNSMKEENTLNYIYNRSGGKYEEVLLTMAEKNLTADYDNDQYVGMNDGAIAHPPAHKRIIVDDVKSTESIIYSSMHYYYVNPMEFGKKTQLSFDSTDGYKTLEFFILEDGRYRRVYTHKLNEEFVINVHDFGYYSQLAFAIIDSSIEGEGAYDYEVNTDGQKIPTVTPESLGLKSLENINKYNTFVCHQVEDRGNYRSIIQVKLSFNKKGKVSDMYVKGTTQIKNYNPDDPSFEMAKKITTEALRLLQKTYEKQFKYYDVITYDDKDRYSVTFRVLRNQYEALNSALDVEGETKASIIQSIQADGFSCSYYK